MTKKRKLLSFVPQAGKLHVNSTARVVQHPQRYRYRSKACNMENHMMLVPRCCEYHPPFPLQLGAQHYKVLH